VATSDNDLLPPLELLSDGTVSLADYASVGEGFVEYFLINHARLFPHETVLDLGSGIGQKARPLARYLTGTYEGLDVMPDAVQWCQSAYERFPNFHFQVADLHSVHYNPGGKLRPEQYSLPYKSEMFDLVLLSSVFTHMLPAGVARYFSEISRVLKPAGRCVATYFLLNEEAHDGILKKKNVIAAPHQWSEGCFVADPKSPETTVFHEESRIRGLYTKNGLNVIEITFGYWSGRTDLVGCLQDVIISIKPR
jgi:SAM-dependent methyltransferase